MTAPAVDDGRVVLSNGTVGTSSTYNAKFSGGQPYTVSFLSSTQLKITDALGNDVTAEASQNGVISNANGANQTVSFRGVDLKLNINLKSTDTNPDAVIAGHSFHAGGHAGQLQHLAQPWQRRRPRSSPAPA